MKGGVPEHFPFINLCNILTFAPKELIAWVPFFSASYSIWWSFRWSGLRVIQIVICNLFMDCDSNYNKLDQCCESGPLSGTLFNIFRYLHAKYCHKWSKSLYYPINWYKIDDLLLFVVYVFYIFYLLVYLLTYGSLHVGLQNIRIGPKKIWAEFVWSMFELKIGELDCVRSLEAY